MTRGLTLATSASRSLSLCSCTLPLSPLEVRAVGAETRRSSSRKRLSMSSSPFLLSNGRGPADALTVQLC